MRMRKIVLLAVLLVIGLPVALLLIAVGWITILDRATGTMLSSGEEREYLLHVPPAYDASRPVPLVIALHAGATWPAQMRNLTGWSRLADQHGFIVVYPGGTGGVIASLDVPRIWRVDAEPGRVKDITFITELIDTLQAAYSIDPARIYATGMSNGGAMAYVLSCVLSDRIAAVGVVAGAQSVPAGWCTEADPVPVIAFHGTADPLVPYLGGRLNDSFNPVRPVYPPVADFIARWARRNGCAADGLESLAAVDVVRRQYSGCSSEADVVLYTIAGGGHTWPGGKRLPEWRVGLTSGSVDATRRMWEFFREHPLPAAPGSW